MSKQNKCPECGDYQQFRHLHDEAHGIPGTHMAGSERFVCLGCHKSFYACDADAVQFDFILDVRGNSIC